MVNTASVSTFVNNPVDKLYNCRDTPSIASIMTKAYSELTKAEWIIINAVWDSEPCSAPGVQQRLAKKTRWTYSTVRTLMDRMVAKGLLTAEKVRNLSLYRSAITQQQAQRGELLYALKHAFNGALTPMLQCLLDAGDLSEAELDEIGSLINSTKKGARRS